MRFYRFIAVAIVVLSVVSCQSGSAPASSRQATLKVNIQDEPQSLDPRKVRQLAGLAIVRELFDGLMRVSKEGKPELAVAESVDVSSDGKCYTFHLRETRWSNGDPVTAHDFAYAWKTRLSPNFPSDTADSLYVIKHAKAVKEGKLPLSELGIRAASDHILVVELESPTAYFPELVSHPSWVPVNQRIDQENPSWFQNASSYVSNGPFSLAEWNHSSSLVLKKNPSYWDHSAVHLSSIEFYMLAEETELNMFEKKEVDWAGSPLSTLPLDAIKSFKKTPLLGAITGCSTDFLRINTRLDLLSDARIRRALALAINRKELTEHVMQGGQVPALGLVPPSIEGGGNAYFSDADAQLAHRLFDEALLDLGVHKENLPELSYLYRSSERNHLIAQTIQQQWREVLGFNIKLEAVESKVFFSRISKKDYQIAFGNWVADFADPINFLEVFKTKLGSNNTEWENSSYTELLSRAAVLPKSEHRTVLLREAEEILMREMPIIPLSYMSMVYVVQPYVKGVALSPMAQIDFKWAEIEDHR
jgi:oligopeptide transport system substrate-binding protein